MGNGEYIGALKIFIECNYMYYNIIIDAGTDCWHGPAHKGRRNGEAVAIRWYVHTVQKKHKMFRPHTLNGKTWMLKSSWEFHF